MNPFRRAAARFVNWWRGEKQDSGGMRTINSESFLESLGLRRKRKPLSEVTYFTCLKLLSETLAKMPIKFYQKTDKGIIEAKTSDASKLLIKRPNPFMTPTTFWNTVEMNRNHWGNAYVYVRKKFVKKKYGGDFKIIDLWIMQSDCVQVVVDDAGIFAGAGRLWYVYTDKTSGRQYVFGTDEVMHFKTSFSFDGITGLPVQQILKDTVSGAKASQDFMNKMYETGLTAKATLEYTGELSPKAKDALIQSFEDFGSGARNTGKIIPVPLGMKLTPLDIKMTDSQFFELKKYTALQIAAAFGVKPNQINDYSKSSYSNSELQQLSFYVDTELFIIKQYEEEINYKILTEDEQERGFYYKFNEKVLFRTDSKTQMEYLKNGVQGSIIKANEARRKLDYPDADGGDVLLANGSIVPLTMAGAAYTKGLTQTEETEEPEEQQELETTEQEKGEPDDADNVKDEENEEGGE
jgi:HK97 family phage portal protein